MNQVFIHAYLQGNLGDDLFVRLLCQRYPNTKFCILSHPDYKEKFKDIENCKIYSENNGIAALIDKFLRGVVERKFWKMLVRSAKAVVHIGGSSFVQHFDDWSAFFETDVYLAEKSKGLYLIGANFGPYTDGRYLTAYHSLFQKYKGISFRDSRSYHLFADIDHVSWAPDVIFNLKTEKRPKRRKVLLSPVHLGNRTGKYDISGYEADYLAFHTRMIRHYLAKEYEITLVSFCPAEGDGIAVQNIWDSLTVQEREKIRCVAYEKRVDDILYEFAESSIVIGTRFHSIILGLTAGCKVLPVIYNVKTENVLRDLHCPNRLRLDELCSVREEEAEKNCIKLAEEEVERLRREADRQFQYTDQVFKR